MTEIIHRLKSAFIKLVLLSLAISSYPAMAAGKAEITRIPTQFIAALGDPDAKSGTGAQHWGLWRLDPGRTGLWVGLFDRLKSAGGYAPGNWKFDDNDWWLEEHGLIMEKPEFPMPPGKYLVTGEREVTTLLTVFAADENGEQRWQLDEEARLFDVTHLPCRSARYTPVAGAKTAASCSPSNATKSVFPITPGAPMPPVAGCLKQDYAVLLVLGIVAN